MSWYYEKDGNPVGPVTEEAYQAARASGVVGPNTRVWKEGWPDWRLAGEAVATPVYTGGQPPPVPRSAASGMGCCAECNQYAPDLVSLGGVNVCESCKPRALDKLREGVILGAGPWRKGNLLVMHKTVPLPEVCLKCGAPPVKKVKKTLSWHHPLLYLTLFAGCLIYLIIALILRKSATVFLPVCAECNKRRLRNIAIATFAFVCSGAAFIAGGVSMNDDLSTALVLCGVGLVLFTLIWILVTQFVLPQKINDTHAWVKKAGAPFLDRLPQWNGPE